MKFRVGWTMTGHTIVEAASIEEAEATFLDDMSKYPDTLGGGRVDTFELQGETVQVR